MLKGEETEQGTCLDAKNRQPQGTMRSENNQRCEKSDVQVTWAVTQMYLLTHMMSHDEFTNQRL
jgi:hypothetical protein